MHSLIRSLTFHLVMPYFVHLALVLIVIRSLPVGQFAATLFFGGWIVMHCIAIIGIPFGLAHVLQAIYFAPSWESSRKQFLVGLLNPSFAAITFVAIFYLAPRVIL